MTVSDSGAFRSSITEESGRRTICLAGELDGAEVVVLSDAFDGVEKDEHVVVDGSELTFVDSMGLRLLVEWHVTVTSRGGNLVLRSPSPALRRLIEATNLDDLLVVADEPTAEAG